MKHLKTYKIFESSDEINLRDTVKDIFLEVTDLDDRIKIHEEELYDSEGYGSNQEKFMVGYMFTIDINPEYGSEGNPYSGHEIDISKLKDKISKFSSMIKNLDGVIQDCLARVKGAGYKITHYSFGQVMQPQHLQIKFAVSII